MITNTFDVEKESMALAGKSAEERAAWAIAQFGERLILSSSFGIQAAVCLHMTTRLVPDIPVVLVDTGYLFPETYRFIDELTDKLKLNLKVYRAALSAGWFEARYGKLWEHGIEGLTRYNEIMKVEPMRRALTELDAHGWISGLRRSQSSTRKSLDVLRLQDGRIKVHPIVDWTDRDVHRYLTEHGLPYHPLREEGYVSIGDTHSTRKLTDTLTEEETRFGGLKRECGIHESTPLGTREPSI